MLLQKLLYNFSFQTKKITLTLLQRLHDSKKIINGRLISNHIIHDLKSKIQALRKAHNIRQPKLAIILVGHSPASISYVTRKREACSSIGIENELYQFDEKVSKLELLKVIKSLNVRNDVDGVLVQLPLPEHIPRFEIIHAVDKDKDVDCLHMGNVSDLLLFGEANELLPCTPAACLSILDHYNVNIEGMKATVIGRSHLVGFPLSVMLLRRNATITICHSFTTNLKEHVQKADLVVAAAGNRHLIKGDWIKKDAIVIDIGINPSLPEDKNKIVGDVEFEKALKNARLITPVPGGVGPMTVSMLMRNLSIIWQRKFELSSRRIDITNQFDMYTEKTTI